MWYNVLNDCDVQKLLEDVDYFHDSCIKELRYISGAYVNEELSMYPLNDRRILDVIVQRQSRDNTVIELEFSGLKYLKHFPVDESYTCEITESTMFIKDGYICWADGDTFPEDGCDIWGGIAVCAASLRWRAVEDCLGDKEIYRKDK